jgi:hypothetical protein
LGPYGGQQVEVVRVVTGERLPASPGSRDQTSDQWYEIRYGDETRYVHSSFVAESSLEANGYVWVLAGVIAALVSLTRYKLVGWSRVVWWQAQSDSSTAN